MAEAVIGVAVEEAVGGCINQIKHHFNYLEQYHDNMENLNNKLKNLESKRTEVQDEVLNATDKGETIRADVRNWLGEVAGKVEEAEKILKDKKKVGNGCWKGWVVNLKPRYSLSKKAMKKSGDLDTFLAGGVFAIVAHSIRPLSHVFDPVGASNSEKMKNAIDHQILEVDGNEESKDETTSKMDVAGADGGLTSRSVLLNDVMEAVKDPKIRMIRICGMGGIGKTTIAKQVEQRARKEYLFHEIAMVEVNKNPDLKILQLHIAELFGLEFKEDSVPSRAKRLCERLTAKEQNGENKMKKEQNDEKKRILLILDNVWKKEDLEEAGIPLTDEKSLCKILVTSRSDLVCKDIAPAPEFNIGVLPHPENLILFRQCIPKESFYDQKMAEDLVKECGGLPISITAIAGAVAYKAKESWTDALRKLRKSDFKGEYARVFNSLNVSYEFLENEEIKRFFRLFCFFQKGSDVSIEDLARYGMALGCFTDPDKLFEARNEALSYAETLLHSNLLLRGGKAELFKLHDIIWDFAVAAPSSDLFVINHGNALIKSPRTERYKNYTSISLQCNEMVEVPKGIDFRYLKFLQLIGNSGTLPLKFPDILCEEMHELSVLAFRSLDVTTLPKSLKLLNNLLSLSFYRCVVGSDISIIGNLGRLEQLSFAHSNIQELPIQIANLKELRLLDMTGCDELLTIAPHVLSELSSLEELYMRDTRLEFGRNPTIFLEISSMSKLVVLDIVAPDEVLPMDSLFAKLEHFKISITTSYRRVKNKYLFENYLDLECDSTVLQQPGVKLLLQETLIMRLEITSLKNLFPLNDSEVVNFSKLKILKVRSCSEMVCLVNMMGNLDQNNVFQDLVSLQLYKLPRLVDILNVRSSNESFVAPFCNLKVLNVESCDELECLFSLSDARSLNKLEDIKVISCDKLKVVFGKGRHGEEKVEFRSLKYMTLKSLPNLVGFCTDVDAPVFPQLEELTIEDLPLITSIVHPESTTSDSSHDNDSSSHPLFGHKGLDTACNFQKLRLLIVALCNSLRHISTTSVAILFRELQHLKVYRCKSLTTLLAECIIEEKEKESVTEVFLFPKLNILALKKLKSLSTFTPEGYTLAWSSLKEVKLKACGRYWNVCELFPNKNNIQGGASTSDTNVADKLALTSLEELSIRDVNITSGFWYDYFPGGFSYQLRKFTLDYYEESILFSPRMIREFRHLISIRVGSCSSLEVFFDLEQESIVGEVGSKLETLNELDCLLIDSLPKLVNVWKKIPQNFQGFGNLRALHVFSCDSLKYLFVPSIAKCLVKLKRIKIENCELMEEVVSMQDEQGQLADNPILFPLLEELSLEHLPSLKYLETPNVVESIGAHDNVSATSTSNEESTETVQGIVCPWPWSFHKLENIEVSTCHKLLSIFPLNRVVRLPALQYVSISDCECLQHIFSSSTASSLGRLVFLRVVGCKMIELILKDEEVDERIKVVFHSLTTVKLTRLPNLEGICLGMQSFDWPSLTLLEILYCSDIRTFTSGYSTTPVLYRLCNNKEVYYYPTEEERDVNAILLDIHIKAAYFALLREGTLTITAFHLAGEHLIAHYSSWSWDSSYIGEQYLIARNVPCLRKARWAYSDEVDHGEDEMNIYKPRTYDVSITYDRTKKSTRLWLKGYDVSKMNLRFNLVLEDINKDYDREYLTRENHPYESGQHVSLFPKKESSNTASALSCDLRREGFQLGVENHLQLFVDYLFPNLQFGRKL